MTTTGDYWVTGDSRRHRGRHGSTGSTTCGNGSRQRSGASGAWSNTSVRCLMRRSPTCRTDVPVELRLCLKREASSVFSIATRASRMQRWMHHDRWTDRPR